MNEGRAILIRDDEVTKQLRQVFSELGLELKEALTRCIECNSELESRIPAVVAERVPPYVRRTQSRYSECPECGRIYWAGTHWQRMREVVEARQPMTRVLRLPETNGDPAAEAHPLLPSGDPGERPLGLRQ